MIQIHAQSNSSETLCFEYSFLIGIIDTYKKGGAIVSASDTGTHRLLLCGTESLVAQHVVVSSIGIISRNFAIVYSNLIQQDCRIRAIEHIPQFCCLSPSNLSFYIDLGFLVL